MDIAVTDRLVRLLVTRYGVNMGAFYAKFPLDSLNYSSLVRIARRLCNKAYHNGKYPFYTGRVNARNLSSIIGRSIGGAVILGEIDRRVAGGLLPQSGKRIVEVLCGCGNVYQRYCDQNLFSAYTRSDSLLCPTCNPNGTYRVLVDGDHPEVAPPATPTKFGLLTVVGVDPDNPKRRLCQCECGGTASVFYSNLLAGRTKSCGCVRRGRKVVGLPAVKAGLVSIVGRLREAQADGEGLPDHSVASMVWELQDCIDKLGG